MTNALMRGKDLIGQPVVDTNTGDDVAEIKDVIFDVQQGAITGFTLRKRGFLGRKLKQALTIDRVTSVGTHAVMIDGVDALDGSSDEADVAGSGDVLKDMVITESGRMLGNVADVIVEGGPAPHVVGFEISGGAGGEGLIPIGAKSAVSGSALIVPDAYEQRIRTDLTGLAAELALIDRSPT